MGIFQSVQLADGTPKKMVVEWDFMGFNRIYNISTQEFDGENHRKVVVQWDLIGYTLW